MKRVTLTFPIPDTDEVLDMDLYDLVSQLMSGRGPEARREFCRLFCNEIVKMAVMFDTVFKEATGEKPNQEAMDRLVHVMEVIPGAFINMVEAAENVIGATRECQCESCVKERAARLEVN